MWSNRTPKLNHLRPFCCLAYIHVNQDKTNPRDLITIFLGYPMGTKSYKVWLIDELKCIISRDIVFNEFPFYKDLFKSNKSQSKHVHIKVKNIE